MSETDDVEIIAAEIMAYLQRRPKASDSLEGIVHWWLMQQSIAKNKSMVEQALEKLTKEGKVKKRTSDNRQAVYGLNPGFKSGEE